MPTLLSRSKHEEFESNSTSYIRDQEERRAENRRNSMMEDAGSKLEDAGRKLAISLRHREIFAMIAKISQS